MCPRTEKGLPYGQSEETLEAVRKWRFEPATYDNKPVLVRYHLTIDLQE